MALRGGIGNSFPPHQEFDEERELLRQEGLILAIQAENIVAAERAKMDLFGPHAHGDRGNIVAGSLTEARFESFFDLMDAMAPFEKFTRPNEKKAAAPVDENKARLEFLKTYNAMLEAGKLGPKKNA